MLLTGHTGFKGAWLALWLERLGAEVTGVSLAPVGSPHRFGDYAVGEKIDHVDGMTIEEAEHSHIFWATATNTLAMADSGEVSVIFPTRRNLEKLAQAPDFAGFSDHARQFPIDLVTPWIEDRDGQAFLCIPGHLGYPVTSESFERVRRG